MKARVQVSVIDPRASASYQLPIANVSYIEIVASATLDVEGEHRYIVDFYAVADLTSIGVDKNILGDLVVSSEAINAFGVGKNLSDDQPLEDSVVTLLILLREYADEFGVSDEQLTAFGKNLTEVLASGDDSNVDFAKNIAEIQPILDQVAADFAGSLEDLAPVGDIVNFVTGYVRVVDEELFTDDAFDRVVQFRPTLEDLPVIEEALAVDFVREPFTDTFTPVDTSIQTLELIRSFADANINLEGFPGTFNEHVYGMQQFNGDIGRDRLTAGFGKNLEEDQPALDSFDRVLVWDKLYADEITQSETLEYLFAKSLEDAAPVLDELQSAIVWFRDFSDDTVASDAVAIHTFTVYEDSVSQSDSTATEVLAAQPNLFGARLFNATTFNATV